MRADFSVISRALISSTQPTRLAISWRFVRRSLRLFSAVALAWALWLTPAWAERDEARTGSAPDEIVASDTDTDTDTDADADAAVGTSDAVEAEDLAGEGDLEIDLDDEALDTDSDIEVIRITGKAATAAEIEVTTAVAEFDAAVLEALGAQNIADLAKVTPNLEIKVTDATAPTFFIRGVGLSDFAANAAGAVSVYRDDVAINAPAIQLGQLFDVENVVVLKGPQGGGSGRNASGGAIKIKSRRPTGELTAELRSAFGNYGYQSYEGALEVPLVEDALAARLAFRVSTRDGTGTNGCAGAPGDLEARLPDPNATGVAARSGPSLCGETPNVSIPNPRYPAPPGDPPLPQNVWISGVPTGLPRDVNDAGVWSARGQLRFQPVGTDMDWLLNVHGSRMDQLSTLGQAIGTNGFFGGRSGRAGLYQDPDIGEMRSAILARLTREDPGLGPVELANLANAEVADELARNLDIRPRRGDYNRVGKTKLDSWGTFLRGDLLLGSVDLTTISGFETYDRFRDQDQDFTPDVLFEQVSEDQAWQFTQELRLSGELSEQPLRWEVGGYYLMEQLDWSSVTLLRQKVQNVTRDYEQDLWSFAFFAGFSWDFLDDFTLEAGGRYNWERKDFDYTLAKPQFFTPVSSRTQTGRTWQAPTGTISLAYRFAESSVYWKYSRGWKGGHFNATAQVKADVVPARPESIDAFETGLRARWLDDRIVLNGSLFYYRYTDYQVFLVIDSSDAPPTYQIINANDAEVYGADADITIRPIDGLVSDEWDGLELQAHFGWLESQFLDFSNELFYSVPLVIGDPNSQPRIQPVSVDYSGNRLINSPRFKLSMAAEWTFDLAGWGSLIPRYDGAWSDDIFFDVTQGRGAPDPTGRTNLPEYTAGQRAFWLHNVRLAYRTPEGDIEVSGWIRNVGDKVYKTFAFDASTFAKTTINFVGDPRTYGLSLSLRW